MSNTVTLWYFEFCANNSGVWDRIWAPSKAALATERKRLRKMNSRVERTITPNEEMDGHCGCNGRDCSIEVPLTARGILAFAEQFAVDDCQ